MTVDESCARTQAGADDLQNHCEEECLSPIAWKILDHNVKVNYEEVVQDFLHSKQCCQLFNPIKLVLEYNTRLVF